MGKILLNITKILHNFDEFSFLFRVLQAEHEACTKKLQRAQELISGLGGERSRWSETAKQLGLTYNTLTGDVLISSGVVAYLGPFTIDYRVEQIRKWSEKCSSFGIVCSQDFQLLNVLGEPVEIRNWNICGLPTDSFSIESAIMMQ